VFGLLGLLGCPNDATDVAGSSDSSGGSSDAESGQPTTIDADDSGTSDGGMTDASDGGTTEGETTEGDTTEGDTTEGDTTGDPAECGDGVVDPDEACDDGGESATCNADCTTASCGDGTVNTTAGEACDDEGESATCNGDCTMASCGDGTVNASAGEDCDDGGESATCDVDCTPAMCGDAVFNASAGEQCDDGARSAACNADCTNASCGDGIVNTAAGEDCDDSGESAACNSDCSAAMCGDGITNATAGEACDDAGDSLTCNADCTAAMCGDGVVNAVAGEDCDDSGESATCDADCTTVMCGDGVANPTAGEACDDAGDSMTCNADCTPATCGDGVVNMAAGEDCDDSGESATCDADCTTAACGDGVLNPTAGEACDDGGTETTCDLMCNPCPTVVVFSEDFSDNSQGWTLGPEWQIEPAMSSPSPGACGSGDPGADHTDTADNGIAGAIIGGNVGTNIHPFYYLTSPVVDTSAYTHLEVSLWRWLNSDYTPYMQNQIEVYDGATWQVVWQSGGPPNIEDAAWTEQTYDVTAFANPAMQIRIGYDVDDSGVFTCSGWNLDDVTIRGTNCGCGDDCWGDEGCLTDAGRCVRFTCADGQTSETACDSCFGWQPISYDDWMMGGYCGDVIQRYRDSEGSATQCGGPPVCCSSPGACGGGDNAWHFFDGVDNRFVGPCLGCVGNTNCSFWDEVDNGTYTRITACERP